MLPVVKGQRINLIGASGSGTSTLGRALGATLSLPCFDSDDYYHAPSDPPFEQPRPPEERHRLITADLSPAASWVLAGGVAGWTPYPELGFTLVVFLWVPTDVRLQRLRRRERERFVDRIVAGGDMHEAHEAFIEWASRYDHGDVEGKTLALHQDYLAQQTCGVLELRGVLPVSHLTREVLAVLDH